MLSKGKGYSEVQFTKHYDVLKKLTILLSKVMVRLIVLGTQVSNLRWVRLASSLGKICYFKNNQNIFSSLEIRFPTISKHAVALVSRKLHLDLILSS